MPLKSQKSYHGVQVLYSQRTPFVLYQILFMLSLYIMPANLGVQAKSISEAAN